MLSYLLNAWIRIYVFAFMYLQTDAKEGKRKERDFYGGGSGQTLSAYCKKGA